MIYVLAALLPPLGLLLNGQPFSALFNVVLIVFCAIFGLIFHVLLLVSVGARGHRGPHEAGGAPAPGGGRGDPSARSAARLLALGPERRGFS